MSLPAATADGIGFPLPSRADFAKFLSQHARLVEFETPLPAAALVVERFSGHEGISELFRFEIDCLSTSVNFELKSLIGEEITLRLLQADSSKRTWHGIVAEAAQLGGDGGLARYRLTVEPWLAQLRTRQDCRILQDKNVLEIAEAVLGAYRGGRYEIRVSAEVAQTLPRRAVTTQYRESDLDFLQRLLAAEGLSWYFEHDQNANPQDADRSAPHSKHQLVIVDASHEWPSCGQETIRYHRLSAAENTDSIHSLSATRQVGSNAVSLASWDHRNLVAHSAQETTVAANGELPTLEDYSGAGQYRHRNAADAARLAKNRMRAFELANKHHLADSSVRRLEAGRVFKLTEHPEHREPDNRFLVLRVEHHAANNIEPGMRTLLASTEIENGSYHNQAVLVRADIPVVPTAPTAPAAPIVPATRLAPQLPGLTSALVVGLDGQTVGTDRDLRIRVQFPWQRGEKPNPGGLAGKDHAPGNETAGTWVRVSQALAGPNWGANFTPRIGGEVLVEFIEGDPDRPLVVASLYNGQDTSPFAAGQDSGVNHPGVVSGHHSQSHDGNGYNQWLADDAPGQLRQRIASSGGASQLSLGYLVRQAPANAQRGAWRGEGFELATDGWSTLRTTQGLMLSSGTRANGVSTQLDAAESLAQLKAAQELGQQLSDSASAQKALKLDGHQAGRALDTFLTGVDPKQTGKYEGPVGGQEATKPTGEARQGGDPVERFAQPIVLADTPTSLILASPAATALHAGNTLSAVSRDDTQLSATHTVSTVSGQTTSLYTHSGGLQTIAANGPVSLQAHTDKLEVLADKSVTVTSSNDEIEILAQSKIRLVAGQSEIVLEGSNIDFRCPGTWEVKGGSHGFAGPASDPAVLPILPLGNVAKLAQSSISIDALAQPDQPIPSTGNVAKRSPSSTNAPAQHDQFFVLRWANSGNPVKNRSFRVRRDNGMLQQGTTDGDGRSPLLDSATKRERIAVEILPEA